MAPATSTQSPTHLISILPNSAPAGISTVNIIITGASCGAVGATALPSCFNQGATALWNSGGTPVSLPTTFNSSTQLTASVPSTLLVSPTTAQISVTQPDSTSPTGVLASDNSLPFAVLAPSIQSLSPSSAAAAGAAFTLTVSGANFVSNAQPIGASQIIFGGTPLSTTFINSGTLAASIPASLIRTAGPVSVTVINPGGATSAPATFTVSGGASGVTITTTGLAAATVGSTYDFFLLASGGTPPYVWSATGLPSGLTLNANTGEIRGTPATAGNFTVAVRVTDSSGQAASAQFPLTVNSGIQPLTITTASLPDAVSGSFYNAAFAATGGVPDYTFSLASGSLPAGLRLETNGGLSGIPTTIGSFPFTIRVTDTAGNNVSKAFVLNVTAPQLTVTGSVSDGAVGTQISAKFGATGGVPPYSFSITGSVPPGTSLAPDGTLSGTLTTEGVYTFTITVKDSAGSTGSKSFTITVTGAPLSITTASLPPGNVGVAYNGALSATGGTPPYTWSGTAGSGLSVSSSGAVTGTPTAVGNVAVSATVTDSKGQTASKSFTVVIAAAPPTISTTSLPGGQVGVEYNATLAATGGNPPYTWSGAGAGGLTVSSSGVVSGTPTTVGNFTLNVTVTDSQKQTASKSLLVVIAPAALSVSTAALPGGTVGSNYSMTLTATGGVPPYTFTAAGLPPGLSVSPGGTISGTPTAGGTFNVAVTVRDNSGTPVVRTLTLMVALPPAPPVTFPGLTATIVPLTQPVVKVTLGNPYPVAVTADLTLSFASAAGADDPMIVFANGTRTARVTLPAGSTADPTGVPFQAGTVAGTITVTAALSAGGQNITPTPPPTATLTISPAAPVLRSVTATRTSSGINVVIVGYTTTREATSAVFTFTAGSGFNLQSSQVTVDETSAFAQYFGSSAATPTGGQFTLTQPFNVSGNTQGVTSVSVTLANKSGTSSAMPANLQ